MEDGTLDSGVLGEAVVFLEYFQAIPDHRQHSNPDQRQRRKVVYPPDEVLLLSLLAVLAGAETFLDSSFKCNTHGPQGIGCCDGQTI